MQHVGLYARVSTEEQKIYGLSIEAQTAALDEWAKEHGAKIVDHYVDAGLSARKPAIKRPELQRLLRDVEAGKINVIVFTKLDRWFRNVGEYYKVQEILEAHNVNWKAIHEDYDTITAAGRLKINIMLAVAQDEADRTSERIKAVFDRKKQRCEVISGMMPLGLKIVDKKMVPDEEVAPMIKDMFRAYIALRSTSATQRYMRLTYNLNYDISTIKRLLKNQKYTGEAYGTKNFGEPLIDRATFNHVQEILADRAQRMTKLPAGRVYMFKGLISCPLCGHIMTACVCKDIYYYRCTRRVTVGDCGFDRYVREDEIEKYLIEHLLMACHEYNVTASTKARNKPKVDEAAIKRKLERLKDLYISDLIQRDDYERDYLMYTAALEDAQGASTAAPILIDTEAIKAAVSAYAGLDRPRKKEFWSGILSTLSVLPDGAFSFDLRHT